MFGMRASHGLISATVAAFVLSANSIAVAAPIPGLASPARSSAAFGAQAPDKRGTIQFFDDTAGDATPMGIAPGPDRALWITDTGNDLIARVSVRGKYTQQMPPFIELSDGITTGPDGALWFTAYGNTSIIGRITTSGALTTFTDAAGTFPQLITTGPDGALWYGESNGSIGRITTAGAISHFSVAGSTTEIEGIVSGPDGALWATEALNGSHETNVVVRLTTNGKVQKFQVGDGPGVICVGPDGALWFTEDGALGRLTTGGTYTEVQLPAKLTSPEGIATGPDGALWFTAYESGVGVIGRLTMGGKFRIFAGAGSPQLITAGPDGAMWFSSPQSPSAVGRIATH
jgi:virginiamycin B lyase